MSATDLHSLRDPAAIAAARNALAVAEMAAEAEEQRAREQANAEAKQAAEDEFRAEIDAALGPWEPVTAARQLLAGLRSRHLDARASASEAEAQIGSARAMLPELVERGVRGEAITPEDIEAAHAAVAAAERAATFRNAIANRLAQEVSRAEAAVRDAIARAHEPVFMRGADVRIEAAIMADRAKADFPRIDQVVLAAARDRFAYGNRIIHYAIEQGVTLDGGVPDFWPPTERSERRRWGRPAPGEAA